MSSCSHRWHPAKVTWRGAPRARYATIIILGPLTIPRRAATGGRFPMRASAPIAVALQRLDDHAWSCTESHASDELSPIGPTRAIEVKLELLRLTIKPADFSMPIQATPRSRRG